MDWDNYFINTAQFISLKSKDPSTKIGCIIVDKYNVPLISGFNGFAMGVNDKCIDVPERYDRPAKYAFTVHAEASAVGIAARTGRTLYDSTFYMNYWPGCCASCAGLLIDAGIKRIIVPDRPIPSTTDVNNWRNTISIANQMFLEAGVSITIIPNFNFIVPLSLP